ncbi:MAG: hypothetical protein LBQ24_03095 [Candidatus Peribacteria bacterium]|nr:hypothetical protein [Candidatus Peribacteria bacterium]
MRFSVDDTNKTETIVAIDDVEIKTFTSKKVDLAINEDKKLAVGYYKITIKSKDGN